MQSYYALLGVAPGASAEEIETAYQRQRARYAPDQLGELGEDVAQVARERLTSLDRAYATLSDSDLRAAYDARSTTPVPSPRARSGLSRRELLGLVGGAVAGLLLIAIVWALAGSTTTPTVTMARLDKPAPAFELRSLDGGNLRLADYAGKNTVLVNFWYTECAPCIEETPALQQAYQRLSADGLVVIGVNVRQKEPRGEAGDRVVQEFATRFGVTYPIVFDDKGEAGRDFQVLPLPSSFFIDTSGVIRYAAYTTVTAEDVERVFTELQRSPAATR
ncbi:MAG: redoxin domain-containing protein [Roseiflexaceae bacterium]|nr:redoxin domain-containing protein [Roseiflexaceae bacterium]